jgi:hypothetical protein
MATAGARAAAARPAAASLAWPDSRGRGARPDRAAAPSPAGRAADGPPPASREAGLGPFPRAAGNRRRTGRSPWPRARRRPRRRPPSCCRVRLPSWPPPVATCLLLPYCSRHPLTHYAAPLTQSAERP